MLMKSYSPNRRCGLHKKPERRIRYGEEDGA